jgi:hypothetical protein
MIYLSGGDEQRCHRWINTFAGADPWWNNAIEGSYMRRAAPAAPQGGDM